MGLFLQTLVCRNNRSRKNMEPIKAELLDKILRYLDSNKVRKKWLTILKDLQIDTEYEKELLKILKLKKYINERNYTASSEKFVYISEEGQSFINNSSFELLLSKEKEENDFQRLKTENLTLQNTLLILQTKQQKRYILYSSISFILGAIVTNGKDILQMVRSMFFE